MTASDPEIQSAVCIAGWAFRYSDVCPRAVKTSAAQRDDLISIAKMVSGLCDSSVPRKSLSSPMRGFSRWVKLRETCRFNARMAFPDGGVTAETLRRCGLEGKLTLYWPGNAYLASLAGVRVIIEKTRALCAQEQAPRPIPAVPSSHGLTEMELCAIFFA
jgi:hypothetical protein